MARRPLRVIRREQVYTGRVISVVREVLDVDNHRLIRETILHPGSVVIVPFLDPSHMVFVRQYRRAIGQDILELPAGTLAPNERPLACATRELIEETGWRARRWKQLARFYPAPGFLSELMTVFVATDLKAVGAHPEPDELLMPVVLTRNAAMRKIRSGDICDAKSIIGVLLTAGRRWNA